MLDFIKRLWVWFVSLFNEVEPVRESEGEPPEQERDPRDNYEPSEDEYDRENRREEDVPDYGEGKRGNEPFPDDFGDRSK